MTLTLDYTQRLNIVAMLDALERQGRREDWSICDLQKRIDLSDPERDAIGYKQFKDGSGRVYAVGWNPPNGNGNGPGPFEIELNDADAQRLIRAVENHRMVPMRDRSWWEPLVAQLPPLEEAKAATP